MGNSEVGHLNLGAGRPVLQDLPRIDAAIADGSFFERPAFLEACARARERQGVLHLVSLIGPGGVHANDRHLVALVELAQRERVPRVFVHALLDGRDTPPASALGFVADLEPRLAAAHPGAAIASVGGRYYAMDRDKRWERIERGYDAIVHGESPQHAASAAEAIEAAYARGETDEFVAPDRHRRARRRAGRRRSDHPRELPRRSSAAADACPRRRSVVRRLRPDVAERPQGADGPAGRDHDRVRGAACRSEWRSRRRSSARSPMRSPTRAGVSSTSPRPRSTPT